MALFFLFTLKSIRLYCLIYYLAVFYTFVINGYYVFVNTNHKNNAYDKESVMSTG